MIVEASDSSITFEFWSIAGGGTLIDSYTIDRPGANPLLADGDDDMIGSAAADYMNGLSGNDRLDGRGSADQLIGGQGSDTFVFAPGFGKDVISDFAAEGSAHDVIEFSTTVFADWGALDAAISDSALGAVIAVDVDNTITLTGVTRDSLVANHLADFLFV
jgi:Ca2+-binding RTX toxin-like protein